MTSMDTWSDFEQIRHNIKNNTVDRLKSILTGLNDECHTHFSKSGKKQDIIDRITTAFDGWKSRNDQDKWNKAKQVINQVRVRGTYAPQQHSPINLPSTSTSAHPSYATTVVAKPFINNVTISNYPSRYNPYVSSARRPNPLPPPAPTARTPDIRFKESPFYTVEQSVSQVVECPESTSSSDRRQVALTFTLLPDQITKLKAPDSRYQLRLFCTSSIFYSTATTFRNNPVPCLVEFPPTCEVRVNGTQIPANLKGMKKRPGTAPPPDVGKYARFTTVPNRIEMVYVNSQQPVQIKKFYLIVMLVFVTTVDELVTNLKINHHRSGEAIRQEVAEAQIDDDDIIAGPQKMSLKCPLSFMRINTPCRSSKCVHPQCFDATSWLSVNEQTATWLCPVCERILEFKDMIIDGYFNEILNNCPENVEDVMVEADGQWHTTDNSYGSIAWIQQNPAVEPPASETASLKKFAPSPSEEEVDKKKTSDADIVVLDSDDEDDEGRVKRELSMASGPPSSANTQISTQTPQPSSSRAQDVIDLTLDSDEDEFPVQRQTGKRKASDADLASNSADSLKKGRLGPPHSPWPIRSASADGTSRDDQPPPHNAASPYQPQQGSYNTALLPLPPISVGFAPRELPTPRTSSYTHYSRTNSAGSSYR